MNSKLSQSWLPLDRIDLAIQLEPAVFILFLAITSYILYKLLMGDLTPERHRNLRKLFKNLSGHSLTACILFFIYWFAFELPDSAHFNNGVNRFLPWIGFFTIIWGAIVFIKTCRILAFEYLFLKNMQVGVPLLLVNLLTLLLSLTIAGWIATSIFQIQIASVLATSAILSVVLGMALQDTLGNLFAGIALQLDKPYGIGDWVEIYNAGQKTVGIINEVTWRATVLISVTDEIITLPNRVVAQSQVNNFSGKNGPIARSQLFRVPYGTDLAEVREILIAVTESIKGIRKVPESTVYAIESNESWIVIRLVYHLDDYGKQWSIGDLVISKCVESLSKEGIALAPQRLLVLQETNGTKTKKASS